MVKVKSMLSYVYIFLFTIAFTTNNTFCGINVNYWIRFIIGGLWCFILLCVMRFDKTTLFCLKKYLKWFLLPFLIMLLHLPLAYLVNDIDLSFAALSRVISYIIQRVIIICVPLLTAVYFKKDAIKYTFFSIIINYSIVVVYSIYKYGIGAVLNFAGSAWQDQWNEWSKTGTIATELEVHDLTFALGFFILYYLLFSEKKIVDHKFALLIAAVYTYLGFKRIEVASLVVCVLLAIFFIKKGKKSQKYKMLIVSIIILIFLLLFIFTVSNIDTLISISGNYDINFNGRVGIYAAFDEYYEFSPFFIGRGYTSTTLLVNQFVSNGIIHSDVHSDILKSYIDFGFLGFILWVWFYIYITPKMILNENNSLHSQKAGFVYFIFSVYAMFIYLTDNTYAYFDFQICYLIIPFAILFEKININRKEEK